MLRRLTTLGLITLSACTSPGDLSLSTELVDFGPALPGVERVESLELLNRGEAALVVTEVWRTSGSEAFTLPLPTPMTLSRAERRTVEVHYLPEPDAVAEDEATFVLTTDSPEVTATLKARGLPTTPDCALPALLDFGAVARGDSLSLEVSLTNATALEATAFADLASPAGPFSFASASPAQEFSLPAGSTAAVVVVFAPTEAREYAATLRLRRHPLCADQPVRLVGSGVASVFAWTPATLDLGAVAVGATGRIDLTFHNTMFRTVELSDLAVHEGAQPSSTFRVSATGTADLTRLTVPPGSRSPAGEIIPGTATVELTFSPTSIGPRAGQFVAHADLAFNPTLTAPVRGEGGP